MVNRMSTGSVIGCLLLLALSATIAAGEEDVVRRASILFNGGDVAGAISLLEEQIAGSPNDIDAHLTYCEIRVLTGQKEEVRKEYKALAGRYPDNLTYSLVHVVLARQSIAKYRLFEELLDANPGFARGWEEYGKSNFRGGRVREAIQALEHAVELDPDRSRTVYILGLKYRAVEEREKEEAAFRKAAQLDPGSASIRMELGKTLLYKGDLDGAAELLKPLQEELSYDAEYIAVLSFLQYRLGESFEAEQMRKRSLKTRESILDDLTFLGIRCRNSEQVEEGRRALNLAIYLDSTHLEAYMQLGILHRMKGETDKAIHIYTLATQQGGMNQLAWRNLGMSYQDRKDFPMAEKYIRKSIEVDPDYLTGWVDLARTLAELERFDDATQIWHKVIGMAPYGWEAAEARQSIHFLEKGEIPPTLERARFTLPSLEDLKRGKKQ